MSPQLKQKETLMFGTGFFEGEIKVIQYWYCRLCRRRYSHGGLCEDCGDFLKPQVVQMPETPFGEV